MKATNSLLFSIFLSTFIESASPFVIGMRGVHPNKTPRSSTVTDSTSRFSIGMRGVNSSKTPRSSRVFNHANRHGGDVSPEGEQNPLLDLLDAQLCGSKMIYTFAAVRDFVRKTRTSLDWHRPDLILTQNTAKEAKKDRIHIPKHSGENAKPHIYRRYLKHPITADAVKEFISNEKNAKILTEKVGVLDKDKWQDDFNVLETLHRLTEFDGDIIEFDDHFDDKQIVYGLTVNRCEKRISVCFRGTVWGGTDWPTNLNFFFDNVETPEMLKEDGFEDKISVHRGFNSYLNDRKYNDILGQILDLYENPMYKDFKLHICGHSLGGALSALLGFKLASSGKIPHILDGSPITVVSFASPQVGDDGFTAAFRSLESKGYLHHVRVSSQGDVVPVSPTGFGSYQQTGVNLHLHDDSEMDVGYQQSQSFVSQIGPTSLKNHRLTAYYRRLMNPVNHAILRRAGSVQGLYDKYSSKEELVDPRPPAQAGSGTQYLLSDPATLA